MMRSFLLVFLVCFAFWLTLSGSIAPLPLVLGALSAAAVAWLNRDLELVSVAARVTPRFLLYLPWLFKEIVLANIQVVRVVLAPRLAVDPVIVRYRATLSGELPLTTFANSITLTPGTVTVDIDGRELVVHALTRDGGDDILSGRMERRIARVFVAPS